jgi:hypothetical protein
MKIKIISLILAFGLVIFGEKIEAVGKSSSTANLTAPGPQDVLALICGIVTNMSSAPSACQNVCGGQSDPTFYQDLTCCVNSLQTAGQIPSTVSSVGGVFCTDVCSKLTCGCTDLSKCPQGSTTYILANACGSFCCNTGWGSVTNCLAAFLPSTDPKTHKPVVHSCANVPAFSIKNCPAN